MAFNALDGRRLARSGSGHQRRIAHVQVMSASPLTPVESMTLDDGRNGPGSDIGRLFDQLVGGCAQRRNARDWKCYLRKRLCQEIAGPTACCRATTGKENPLKTNGKTMVDLATRLA
jgi:hypothetical protein